MSDDPYALPDWFVLYALVMTGLFGVPALVWRGLAGLLRRERRHSPGGVLRALAALTAAGALGVYTRGLLPMLFTQESSADQDCKTAAGPTHAGDVDGYDVWFLPLRWGCRVDGVGTFEAMVPGYVNPTMFGLLLVTALLAYAAGVRSGAGTGVDVLARVRGR